MQSESATNMQGTMPNMEADMDTEAQGTGSYKELTPREFNDRRDLLVILLKAPNAGPCFSDFPSVQHAPSKDAAIEMLAGKTGQRIGLACEDGDCSGRLAIRLSRMGYRVYHLAGGVREWRNCFRC